MANFKRDFTSPLFIIGKLTLNNFAFGILSSHHHVFPYYCGAHKVYELIGQLTRTRKYRIAGNFRERKLLRIGEKYDFHGENVRGLLAFAAPKDATPQISWRKLSCIATKPRNSQKFSPLKVFRYTVATDIFLHILLVASPLQTICTN